MIGKLSRFCHMFVLTDSVPHFSAIQKLVDQQLVHP
jgi:hypothetical protein